MSIRSIATALAVVALASSPAHADNKTWEGVFVGSVGVAFVGGALFWHGANQIDHAEENLCTGDYAGSCDHAPPTLPKDIAHYNENGDDGATLVTVGGVMLIAGAGLGIFAAYKAFSAKDEPQSAEKVTFTPTLSPSGAGATMQLRW